MSVSEQLAAYNEADIIVQTHGAAAGNLPFMKEVRRQGLLNLPAD